MDTTNIVFENVREDKVTFLKNGLLPQNLPNKRCPVKKSLLFGLFVCVVLFIGILLTWHLVKQTATSDWQEMQRRQLFVKEMMLDSWSSYVRDAWGHEAAAYDRNPMKFGKNSGLSIMASMSTLWIMGMNDEFERAKGWIETELDLRKIDKKVKVFDVVVNYVGGLLSCYALTGDRMFLGKAEEIAQMMEPAFNSSSGIPFVQLNLNTTSESETKGYVVLSDAVGFQLDFNYLSQTSGNEQYRKQIEKIKKFLKQILRPNNLYMEMLGINGKWSRNVSTIFEDSREFYVSLIKSYIQSNQRDGQALEMYKEALDSVEKAKMFTTSPGGLYYGHDSTSASENVYPMSYSGCYLGAMLAMGANAMQQALTLNSTMINETDKVTEQNRIKRHWKLAESLTETCQQASVRTKTGLGPALFHYNDTHDVASVSEYTDQYHLSPELAESNFILWRLTHKSKYRDNAWKMAQAIHRFCRVESGGYAALISVNHIDPVYRDEVQPPIFLSATLKYLYLTFTEDSVLPLEKWVFNSVGHPLPIRGD